MKNTKKAFNWIINLLEKNKIPFRISGGFAAKIYGSERELVDIDIDYDESLLSRILPEIKDFIIYGPERYQSKSWDLNLTTLNYEGQEIDLAGVNNTKIFDVNTKLWINFITDFNDNELKSIFNRTVKVIRKSDLISYKSKLLREVDILDINALKD